jgi:hypothetical protein
MKVCVIFRGENVRHDTLYSRDLNRKYIDALMCWDNWKKHICDDLINNGNECDIAFVTYPSKIIEQIKTVINPKHIILNKCTTQRKNFEDVLQFMNDHKEYDRFVILRCDFTYRFDITKWPKWEETGIFIVNRDVHWSTTKYCSDVMFIVDSKNVNTFDIAFKHSMFDDSMHGITKILYNNNIPFHLMYNEYYHMDKHPLHSMASLEDQNDIYKPKGDQRVLVWNGVVLK